MDFNIDIEYSKFHEEQLQSARDVCLSSKIANQDSMVLISSVFPQPSKNNEVVILTNDTQFYTAFNKGKVSDILQNLNICSPKFINLDTLGKMNLAGVESLQRDDNNKINLYLFNLITKQLKNFFLGKTFTPSGENLPNNCICFKLIDGVPLKNGIYVSVLSKELDFIYTSKKPVRFWNNGAEIFDGFTSSEGNKNISYLITEVDENSIEIPIPNEVLAAIKAEGNHVFVHPDTLLP